MAVHSPRVPWKSMVILLKSPGLCKYYPRSLFVLPNPKSQSNLFPFSGHNPSKAIPELQASLRKAGWQKQRSITVIEEVSAWIIYSVHTKILKWNEKKMLFFLIDVYLLEKYSIRLVLETYSTYLSIKVHIFREGHKIFRNLHLTFVLW